MIRNYFTIAWRNLKNNLMFSILNVLGLSIGMACCLITGLFAYQEYHYDVHHKNVERIYRVGYQQMEAGRKAYFAQSQGTLGPEIIKIFPEVEAAARVGFKEMSLQVAGQSPEKERIMAVDPAYFSIFTIPFKLGPVGDTLTFDGILLSENAARRFFGTKNPINETFSLGNGIDLKVNGVFENFPITSHLSTDFIISFTWIEKTDPSASSWDFNSFYNYVLMPATFDKHAFDKKLNAYIHTHTPEGWRAFNYFIQPLREVNLSGFLGAPRGTGDQITVNGFVLVSIIILLLASLNYMNLATARSAKRALEVGIRKAVGAVRMQLIRQFLIESLILCFISFLLAILWADFGVQVFSSFIGYELTLQPFFGNPSIMVAVIALLLFIAIGSGAYPALFLSRFVPAAVLKGQHLIDTGRRLRKGLVIFQFSLTVLLVVLVIVVLKQTNFLLEKDLGFNKTNLVEFIADRNGDIGIESFKVELKAIHGVKQVASASNLPGFRRRGNIRIDVWEHGKSEDESLNSLGLFIDHDYLPTMELTLLAGRNFSAGGREDSTAAILNETAVAGFGWTLEEAIGKKIAGFPFGDSLQTTVVGVVKDFHISPVRREIMPLVMSYSPDNTCYILRLENSDFITISKQINTVGSKHTYGGKFESELMVDRLNRILEYEGRAGEILTFFTCLAILIGCSGLYALSAFEGEQRIKELGIRKIMGASTRQLLLLLSRDFLKLIVIALFIAMPLAYFVADIWLGSYVYRISWSTGIFIGSSAFVLCLGWLTILTQAMKAARLNPADALRYE